MQISSVAQFSHHNCIRCTTRHRNQFVVAPALNPTTTTRAGSRLLIFSSNHGIGSEKCLTTSSTSSTKNWFLEEVYSASHSTMSPPAPTPTIKEAEEAKPRKENKKRAIISLGPAAKVMVARDQHLAIPHLTVPDISWIDWAELQRRGFKGVVFNKDNTLTAPYSSSI